MEFNAAEMKELNVALKKAFDDMQVNIRKTQDIATEALETSKKEGTIHGEQNVKLKELGETGQKLNDTIIELKTRTLEVEQKLAKRPAGGGGDEFKSMGQRVTESDQFKAAVASKGRGRMEKFEVGSFHKTTILGTLNQQTVTNSAIVMPDYRPGVIIPALQPLHVRSLLSQNTTNSNLIVYAKELLYTNNAGPQYQASPLLTEGALKNESALTFQLANAPVVTLAHWIPASEQIMDDSAMLQGYIDNRLRFGLALEEDKELLNGDGTAGKLNGLVNQATAFNRAGTGTHTALDHLLLAQLQVSLSFYTCDGCILHPIDWYNLLLMKDTLGRYLFSDPQGVTTPRIWGCPVVYTVAQTQGQFLCGSFRMASEIFDRQDATVEISKEHADFFIRNLVAILCEERLALVVYRPAALVKGTL
jgi:HK97 family phage major capsid protein